MQQAPAGALRLALVEREDDDPGRAAPSGRGRPGRTSGSAG